MPAGARTEPPKRASPLSARGTDGPASGHCGRASSVAPRISLPSVSGSRVGAMRLARGAALLTMTCLLAAAPATAQRHARGVYVDAGSMSANADLNTAGTAFLTGGLFVGGGLWWQPIATDSSLTIQGDFVWNRQQLHTTRAGSGTNVDVFLYGLNLDYTFCSHRRIAFTF